ncbi:MAG: hypothetical protein KDN19_14520 [Verrucomicrobiae bacterium]|nr:hypothetical protein [Verrucomicrobiae bacterium]
MEPANFLLSRLVALAAVCLLLIGDPSRAEESVEDAGGPVREFTNLRGDTMSARFLGREGNLVVLRRISNGRVVKIEATQLSLEDQLWLRDQIREAKSTEPDSEGWSLLQIETEAPADSVSVVGIPWATNRVGATAWEVMVPKGCWLEFRFTRNRAVSEMTHDYYWQFGGEKKIRVKAGGQFGWLAREDEADYGAFGMTVRSRGDLDQMRSDIAKIKRRLGPTLSVSTDRADGLTELKKADLPVVAVKLDDKVSLTDVALPMNDLGVKLVAGGNLVEGDLEILGLIPTLEALRIGSAFRSPKPVNWEHLRDFSKLKKLALLQVTMREEPYSLEWLEGVTSLRWLSASGTKPIDDRIPEFPALESLELRNGEFDTAAIGRLETLRVLNVGSSMLGDGQLSLARLPRLRTLDLEGGYLRRQAEQARLSESDIQRLGEQGVFSEIYRLNTNMDLDYRYFPKLRKVGLRNPKEMKLDVARLESAPELEFLELEKATNEDLRLIATLPNLQGLRTLSLMSCDCDNFEVLGALPNLENLRIADTSRPVEELDVGWFPSLVDLTVMKASFHRLIGVARHPALASLYLGYCPHLETLGEAAPNSALISLHVHNCTGFQDLGAVSQADALAWLAYYNNGDQVNPLPFPASAGKTYRYTNLETPESMRSPPPVR